MVVRMVVTHIMTESGATGDGTLEPPPPLLLCAGGGSADPRKSAPVLSPKQKEKAGSATMSPWKAHWDSMVAEQVGIQFRGGYARPRMPSAKGGQLVVSLGVERGVEGGVEGGGGSEEREKNERGTRGNGGCVGVGVWVRGCVGVWVCGCVGVWVCGLRIAGRREEATNEWRVLGNDDDKTVPTPRSPEESRDVRPRHFRIPSHSMPFGTCDSMRA